MEVALEVSSRLLSTTNIFLAVLTEYSHNRGIGISDALL